MDARRAETCIRYSLLILALAALTYTARAQTTTEVRRVDEPSGPSLGDAYGVGESIPALRFAAESHEMLDVLFPTLKT